MIIKLNLLKTCLLSVTAISILNGCSKESLSNSNHDNSLANEKNKNTFFYAVSKADNEVIACPIDEVSGSLGNCIPTGTNINKPTSLAISNNHIYVTNSGTASITKCEIDPKTGLLLGCAKTGPYLATHQNENYKIRFQNMNNIYIISDTQFTALQKCGVDNTSGEITGCKQIYNSNAGNGIAISGNSVYSTKSTPLLVKYDLDTNGDFLNYSVIFNNISYYLNSPQGITTYSPKGSTKTYLYLANEKTRDDKLVYLQSCEIKNDGSIPSCINPVENSSIDYANEIQFLKNKPYVLSRVNKSLTSCDIRPMDDAFINCKTNPTGSGFEDFTLKLPE